MGYGFGRTQWAARVLGVLLVAAVLLAYVAWRNSTRADANLVLAREVLDESLSSADRDPARVGADVPQVQELRRELLEKAERFYDAFMNQEPRSEASRRDLAFAHYRLGHIKRMLEKPEEAAHEYREAVVRFEGLANTYPQTTEYRVALGSAHNWIGETFRPLAVRYALAEQAYDQAVLIQQQLVQQDAANTQYQEELARTRINRGMLRAGRPDKSTSANSDFRETIRLLEPLSGTSDRAAQALARAYHNLGSVLAADPDRTAEVRPLWEQAIGIDERLVIKDPANREYKLDLAIFCDKLAALLGERGDTDEALRRSRMAVDLFENLSRPAPSLAIARADAYNLRGMILQSDDPAEAAGEYQEAIDLFTQLQTDRALHRLPDLHLRLGDLLRNLSAFPRNTRDAALGRDLLSQAVTLYAGVVANIVASGSRVDAQGALENLSRVLPSLPEPRRAELTEFSQQLQRRLDWDRRP